MACATLCYLIYWSNPFSPSQAHTARVVYGATDADPGQLRMPNSQRYNGYELTGMDNEHAEERV